MVQAGYDLGQLALNFGCHKSAIHQWTRDKPVFGAIYDRLRDRIGDNCRINSGQFSRPPLYDMDEEAANLAINGVVSCKIITVGLNHYGTNSDKTNPQTAANGGITGTCA